jgi:tRNA A-37 threonylcarbamoyl transferase component Bud32
MIGYWLKYFMGGRIQKGRGPISKPPFFQEADELTDPKTLPLPLKLPASTYDKLEPGDISKQVDPARMVGDRYVIEQHIAVGGIGRLYRARHAKLGKHYALKVLRRTFADDDQARQRFYQEARALSELNHPHVVSVIDFGDDQRVGVYMVMEYLNGESLRARVARGPLPMKVALDVMIQVSEAMQFAHEKGVIHCDLKPENVFLCTPIAGERRKWTVKIVDFGLAHSGRAAVGEPVAGTPEYLAPERLRGDGPSERSDIYALGVLLYEMLAGCMPFTGTTSEVIAAQLFDAPKPIEEITGQPLPSRAEALINKAMDKDPGLRQTNVSEFLFELRSLMDTLGMARRTSTLPPAPDLNPEAMRRAAEVAPVGFAWLDLHGKILSANAACARLLTGDANAPICGLYIRETPFGQVRPTFPADLRTVYGEGKTSTRCIAAPYLGIAAELVESLSPIGEASGDVLLSLMALEADLE